MVEEIRSKQYMRFLIFFMGLTAILDQYLSIIEITAIPYILDGFNIGMKTFTFWQGIVGIMAFFVFIVSWLGDHYGRKIGILLVILVMSVPALLIGLFGNSYFLLFIILYGIMTLGTNVNFWTVPVTEESSPNKRAINGSIVYLIGLIPIYAFIGVPIAETWGWQWTYGIMGFVGIGSLVFWYFMKETHEWEENNEDIKSRVSLISSLKTFSKRDWKFVGIGGFIYICWSTVFKILSVSLGVFFLRVQGKTPEEWTSILLMAGLLAFGGVASIGVIMERFGRIVGLVYSAGGASIFFFALAYTGLPVFAMGIYYFMPCVLGFLLVYTTEMLPTNIRGVGIGLLSTLSRTGIIIGPLIVSFILPNTINVDTLVDFQRLYLIAGVIIFLPLLTLFFNRVETKGKTLDEINNVAV